MATPVRPRGSPPAPAAASAPCCVPLQDALSPRLFKALGDPRRVELLLSIAQADGPRTVGEIAAGTDVDVSVVSRHLALLRDAGILKCVRRGREVYCSVRAKELAELLRDLAASLEACCPPRADAAAAAAGRGTRTARGR